NELNKILYHVGELFNIKIKEFHLIIINNLAYYMIRVPLDNDNIIYEESLNNINLSNPLRKDYYFIDRMQKLIAICTIFNINKIQESNFLVRNFDDGYYPLLIKNCETNLIKDNNEHTTQKFMDRWFNEKEIGIVINEILCDKYYNEDNDNDNISYNIINQFKYDLVKIIEQNGKSFHWIINDVIQKTINLVNVSGINI